MTDTITAPQYDKPTYDPLAGYKGKHGLEGFQLYRSKFPAGTMIYDADGNELDVRGQPILKDGGEAVAFDFTAGQAWPVSVSLDNPMTALTFVIPTSGLYWMDAGYGAAEGDIGFSLICKGTAEVIASGNAGIDEAHPISLSGAYNLQALIYADSEAVKRRGGTASGYYILRKK